MDEDEMRIINFENICRLCLEENLMLLEIFGSVLCDDKMSIEEKVKTCATIDLSKDDGLPNKICMKCLSSVNAAFEFRLQCENADKTLHNLQRLLISNEASLKKYDVQSNDTEEDFKEVQAEKVVEDLSHIIVIKKKVKSTQPSPRIFDVIQAIKEEGEEEKSEEGIFVEDLTYYEDGENITGDPAQKDEEAKSGRESSQALVTVQTDVQKAYKMVIIPPANGGGVKLPPKRTKSEGGEAKKSACPFCNKMLTRVNEHIRLLHRNRVYVCTKHDCGAEFSTLKNLQSHQLTCFKMKKAYKCSRCGKEFHRKSNYKAHVRRHASKKDFQCQLCERAFVDSTGLRRHFRKHHEPEQEIFISGCCGKRFKSKEGLKKHIRNGVCGVQIFQDSIDNG